MKYIELSGVRSIIHRKKIILPKNAVVIFCEHSVLGTFTNPKFEELPVMVVFVVDGLKLAYLLGICVDAEFVDFISR